MKQDKFVCSNCENIFSNTLVRGFIGYDGIFCQKRFEETKGKVSDFSGAKRLRLQKKHDEIRNEEIQSQKKI